jgi:hypothetical protein
VTDRARIYEFQPSFVLGFHGCKKEVGEAVLAGEIRHLEPSKKNFDWLGSGIYFWEGSYSRADEWARERQRMGRIKEPFVLGAVIDLRHCLDLFDSGFMGEVRRAHDSLCKLLNAAGREIPLNEGATPDLAARRLDCAVMNLMLEERDERASRETGVQPYDSVRGPFLEGDPVYPSAGFRSQTHIQISVRNPQACIKGYFRPLV